MVKKRKKSQTHSKSLNLYQTTFSERALSKRWKYSKHLKTTSSHSTEPRWGFPMRCSQIGSGMKNLKNTSNLIPLNFSSRPFAPGSGWVYECIIMYICVYLCIFQCIFVYICLYLCIFSCIFVYICVYFMYICAIFALYLCYNICYILLIFNV